jgi:hypothetical protein
MKHIVSVTELPRLAQTDPGTGDGDTAGFPDYGDSLFAAKLEFAAVAIDRGAQMWLNKNRGGAI